MIDLFSFVFITYHFIDSLAADQLVYIGLRDIDPYEAYILNKLGIRAFAMDVSIHYTCILRLHTCMRI